jgi:hypothetical protein
MLSEDQFIVEAQTTEGMPTAMILTTSELIGVLARRGSYLAHCNRKES